MKEIFISTVEDGKIRRMVAQGLADYIKGCGFKKVVIEVSKYKAKRSDAQNRYLHAMFTIFKNELNALGNEFKMEEVKELLKAKFALIDVINEATGECIGQRIKGTSEMNKAEVSEFIENVIRFGAEMFGFQIPYPSEEMTLNFD